MFNYLKINCLKSSPALFVSVFFMFMTVSWRSWSASSWFFSAWISWRVMIATWWLWRMYCCITCIWHHSGELWLHLTKHWIAIGSCKICLVRYCCWYTRLHHPKIMLVNLHHHSLLLECCLTLKFCQRIQASLYNFWQIIWISNWNSSPQGRIIFGPRV